MTLLYYTTGLTAKEKIAFQKYLAFTTNFQVKNFKYNWIEIFLKSINSIYELEVYFYIINNASFKLMFLGLKNGNNKFITFSTFKNLFTFKFTNGYGSDVLPSIVINTKLNNLNKYLKQLKISFVIVLNIYLLIKHYYKTKNI